MARYRKKPVEVDAIQWTGSDIAAVQAWADDLCERNENVRTLHAYRERERLVFFCAKSDREVVLEHAGWIIAEADGDGYYPCTAEQFDATYEEV